MFQFRFYSNMKAKGKKYHLKSKFDRIIEVWNLKINESFCVVGFDP